MGDPLSGKGGGHAQEHITGIKGVITKLDAARPRHKVLKRRQTDRKKAAAAKVAAKSTLSGVSRGRVDPPTSPSPGHYIGFSK